MNFSLQHFIFILLATFLASCGATRTLRPLGTGNSQIDFSVGGPIITVGSFPVPASYNVVGYSYGLSDKINLQGSISPSAAAFKNFVMEAGAGVELFQERGAIPEIFLDACVAFGANASDVIIYPILTPVFSYRVGRWSPYLGMDNLFQFRDNDRVWLPQIIAPFVGARADIWSKWELGGEIKWSAANHDLTFDKIPHPKSAFGTDQGVLAPYIFISRRFN